jgi:hypothetical protein
MHLSLKPSVAVTMRDVAIFLVQQDFMVLEVYYLQPLGCF